MQAARIDVIRAGRTRGVHALKAAALIALAACAQNTGGFNQVSHDKPPANHNVGLGFEPGAFDPRATALPVALEEGSGLVGALIPGAPGVPERRVAFYAFATSEPASNLDRVHAQTPDDPNGVADVFVAAIADTRIEVDGIPRPAIFAQAMFNTFSHTRCMTCHSFHFEGGFGEENTTHAGGPSQQNNDTCLNCHDQDIGPGEQGQPVEWRAPLEAENGPIFFDGKGALELCDQVKAFTDDIVEHFSTDTRVFWAMEDALLPTGEVAVGGPAPFRKQDFDDLVAAWVQGDCQCLPESAVRDVVLVSFAQDVNSAADGASLRPSLAFVHNPQFDPGNALATNPAGWLYVAFDSTASDLIALFDDNNGEDEPDVWRARVAVNVDVDGSDNLELGGIDLKALPSETVLVSASVTSPTNGANGSALRAAINAGGGFVAFESKADANHDALVSGFIDGNGKDKPDVYLRNLATGTTVLVSRVTEKQGGNDASSAAAISARSDAVAFETLANDLDFEDVDLEQDVYWAEIDAGTTAVLALYRASVRSGGIQAGVGASFHASIQVDPQSGQARVVYESAKSDLAATGAGLAGRNVYLTTGPAPLVTSLLSQASTSAGAHVGDGDSTAPSLSPDGRWVVYQTTAKNLDTVWNKDENSASDVILLDLDAALSTGHIAGRRLTVAAEGLDGNAASSVPLIAGVKRAGLSEFEFEAQPLCAYSTLATNLGRSRPQDELDPTPEAALVFTVE